MLPSVKFQNLGDRQTNIPFTFGHVFKPGDFYPHEGLRDLQMDVKVLHGDGSVRHAIISGMLAGLDVGETFEMPLVRIAALARMPAYAGMPPPVVARLVLDGVAYSAAASTGKFIQEWLSGPMVSELQTVAPFVTAAGVPHPHLTARFAIRMYDNGPTRVDVTIENCWAYEPNPQNFTYDVALFIGDDLVYSKAALTHYHHARWRHIAWDGVAPDINTQLDPAYLIAAGAVPNYDPAFPPSENCLRTIGAGFEDQLAPMVLGLSNAYMPMTGANTGIGILPMWQAAWVLSMDSRARNVSIGSADGAGSYSAHYRDRKTDRPVTLTDHPRMTIAGRPSDAGADAFPVPGGVTLTPYDHDIAHQPSLAYLPYLMTGDYYYLEELQFWAMYDAFASNPGYRGAELGLVIDEQLRGQAWALRTLAQAAYITPDSDPLKAELTRIVNANFDWYNATYSNNPNANKLGIIVNGYAINGVELKPWMDDFFTSAVGYALDLGFEKARPLLEWKAQFVIGRMTAPGYCWMDGSPYILNVRDSVSAPFYTSFAQLQAKNQPSIVGLPCAGPAMAAALGRAAGDMGNISEGYMGYPSNMQPALAYAVDAGAPNARAAWALFMARTVKPDYSDGSQFSIIPRPQFTEEPKMTFRVSVSDLKFKEQELPLSAEPAAAFSRVEILSGDDESTVIATLDAAPYEFPGIAHGNYAYRLSGIDSAGNVMGIPYVEKFTIPDDAATTRSVMLPSGAIITFTQE